MKVLLFCCLVMISVNQLQGFYIPPKNSCVYNNNCPQEIINGVVQAMADPVEEFMDQGIPPAVAPVQYPQNPNSEAQPMFYYDYPPIKPFLVKEMVDKIWKLRTAFDVRRQSPLNSVNPVRVVRL